MGTECEYHIAQIASENLILNTLFRTYEDVCKYTMELKIIYIVQERISKQFPVISSRSV